MKLLTTKMPFKNRKSKLRKFKVEKSGFIEDYTRVQGNIKLQVVLSFSYFFTLPGFFEIKSFQLFTPPDVRIF